MNLKTAIKKIVELSQIEYFEEKHTTKDFDPNEVLKVEGIFENLDNTLTGIHVPLFKREDLRLSASQMETYNECPLKFKYAYIIEVPTRPRTFFDLGTSVHAVAEQLTNLEKDGIATDEDIAFAILEKEWTNSSFMSETEATNRRPKLRR